MQIQPFILTPDKRPPALNALGVEITVLAANTATRSYEITLQQGAEGIGPPPHAHEWDESFYVLHGDVEFSAAGRTQRVPPGSLVHVPAGTVHAFRFGAGGAGMLELSGAGGQATRMFASLDADLPPGPPDIPAVVGILQRHGVVLA